LRRSYFRDVNCVAPQLFWAVTLSDLVRISGEPTPTNGSKICVMANKQPGGTAASAPGVPTDPPHPNHFYLGAPWTLPSSDGDPNVPGIATYAEDTLTGPDRAKGLGFSRYGGS
jgi:hypothetical protein